MSAPTGIAIMKASYLCWLGRTVLLSIVIGGWLLYAAGLERWRFAEELRTRGKTTIAQDASKPLDPMRRDPFGYRIQNYYYVADGVTYRHTVTSSKIHAGQTVTYLPENPDAHQVGT